MMDDLLVGWRNRKALREELGASAAGSCTMTAHVEHWKRESLLCRFVSHRALMQALELRGSTYAWARLLPS